MVNILTQSDFAYIIENMVHSDSNVGYVDAIVHYCEENEIEIEDVQKLVCPTLKEKLRYEAQNLNYIEKCGRLPL